MEGGGSRQIGLNRGKHGGMRQLTESTINRGKHGGMRQLTEKTINRGKDGERRQLTEQTINRGKHGGRRQLTEQSINRGKHVGRRQLTKWTKMLVRIIMGLETFTGFAQVKRCEGREALIHPLDTHIAYLGGVNSHSQYTTPKVSHGPISSYCTSVGHILYTVKKSWPFSRPQPGCH